VTTPAFPPVPPIRDDLGAKRLGGRIVVEDPVRRVRIPVDALAVEVMRALSDGPVSQGALVSAVRAPAEEVWRRVHFFARHGLLETPRAAAQRALRAAAGEGGAPVAPPASALAAAPLGLHPALAHGCVGCGGCCQGTDIGPLRDDDVARIREVDWSPFLPADVTPAEWIDEVPAEHSPTGAPIRLMGMRKGRCVFLDGDRRCIIHAQRGAAQKPTLCRQFPFVFVRTPSGRVDVSFSTECRAWWQARQSAPPPSADPAQVEAIRALLAEGAPVLELSAPIEAADGLDLDVAGWEQLRTAMLDGLAAARSTPELVQAVVAPFVSRLETSAAAFAAAERFAEREAFGLAAQPPADDAARAEETRRRLQEGLAGGMERLAGQLKEAGLPDEAARARRLAEATEALLSGRDFSALTPFRDALEIWRDLAIASIHGHEPARRGDLALGVAVLAYRILLAPVLAGLSAEQALRGWVHEQEAVDAMVLATKGLRGTAFERLLQSVRRDLVTAFVCDVRALALGEAPGPVPGWWR
jgi:lysine-N-methylase